MVVALVDCFEAFCAELDANLAGERWLELRPGRVFVFRIITKRRDRTDRCRGWAYQVNAGDLVAMKKGWVDYGKALGQQANEEIKTRYNLI